MCINLVFLTVMGCLLRVRECKNRGVLLHLAYHYHSLSGSRALTLQEEKSERVLFIFSLFFPSWMSRCVVCWALSLNDLKQWSVVIMLSCSLVLHVHHFLLFLMGDLLCRPHAPGNHGVLLCFVCFVSTLSRVAWLCYTSCKCWREGKEKWWLWWAYKWPLLWIIGITWVS